MRLRFGALGAILSVAVLGGCGSSSSGNGVASKSANDIVAAATKAAEAASTVHVSGGQTSGGTPLTLDLYLQAGKGGRGKVSEKGISFEVIVLGSTAYIKGSSSFYKQIGGSAAAQLFDGKWLKVPSSNGEFAKFSSLTDLHGLINKVLSGHKQIAKGASTTIDGQKAIAVKDTTKGGTLYVATTGTPYPVQITETGSEAGVVKFEDWNKPVSIKAPSGAIDLSELEAAARH